MTNETKQTALQQLKFTLKQGIGNMNGQLNEYNSGYKQCLIDIENLIDKQLLEMEKEQIIDAYYQCGKDNFEHIKVINRSAKQYYNETFGGNNEND
jgi:hypothetical protein